MRSVAKKELKDNSRKPCTLCGASSKINMYRHVVRCHQDLMIHIMIVLGHKVPGEAKLTLLQKIFPP